MVALGSAATWLPYVYGVALILAATLLGQGLLPFIQPSSNLVVLYLVPVVVSALYWGAGPSIITSVLSILAYRLLFVPQRLPLSLVDDYIMFLTVLIVGLVVSTLATRARDQAALARRAADQTAALYALSRDLAAAGDLDTIARAVVARISQTFACDAAVLLPRGDSLVAQAGTFEMTGDTEEAAALWALRHAQSAGWGSTVHHGAQALYLPLTTGHKVMGVLAIRRAGNDMWREDQRYLLDVFASQAAMAIERAQLAEDARQAYILEATRKMQTALLNSISHDLRTPLASITGSLTSLLDNEVRLDEGTRHDLIETARQQAERLNHLVGNLLDMTRLEAGAMQPVREPCDIQDLIGAALAQLGDRVKERQIAVDLPDDLPMVAMDFVLMTQVLVNLLDNALKYSAPQTIVDISAHLTDTSVQIDVADRGIGIPDDDLPHVFDRFYRVRHAGRVDGSGLGLSLSKGIVELHGGRLTGAHRPGGGTIFSIELPLTPTTPRLPEGQV